MHLFRFRPRFTVRRLMVAVAIVALAIGSCILWGRSSEYASKAREHEEMAQVWQKNADAIGTFYGEVTDPDLKLTAAQEKERAGLEGLARKYDRLAGKYRRAARYPWFSVEPD